METIFALGTGPGRAAIAVIRLSGPTVQQVLIDFTGAVSEPRAVRLTALRDPENGEELDQGLTFFFPGPHSATGEDYANRNKKAKKEKRGKKDKAK
jgi:tRNA modification GTPase